MEGALKAVFEQNAIDSIQELCESWGGRPGLSVLMSLTVSVDVKQHWTMLTHWSQVCPKYVNLTSEDIKFYIIIVKIMGELRENVTA